jgi:hypothetical protein
MRILIACEESQAVTIELRKLGHEAFSCDILPCSGGHPEWHIQGDVLEQLDKGWDMMVAHPPCTYLSVSGARWMYHPDDKHLPTKERRPHPKFPNRRQQQTEGLQFVQALMDAPIDKIAIENPVSVISSQIRKPDQIVQPYHFGDEARKTTCLWLKNLPKLKHTNMVGQGEVTTYASGRTMPKWYADALKLPPKERQKLRSKTFPGIAQAIAEQWGGAC